jgi:hypothetical protein
VGLAKFDIRANPDGTGTVIVNGEDVSDRVRGFVLTAEAHQIPQLQLWMNASGELSGEGIVRQSQADGELIAGFLSALDPSQLEKDVLEALGPLSDDGQTSFTAALLARLAAIAKGEW